jgi:hypothetical protein
MFPNGVLILSCTKVLLTPHFVDKSATRYRMFDRKHTIYVFDELCFCSPGMAIVMAALLVILSRQRC